MSQQVMSGQPIGYFTDCAQGKALVRRFGDRDLGGLSQIDQAALLVLLSSVVMAHACGESGTIEEFFEIFCNEESPLSYCYDSISDNINDLLFILEGVTNDDAIAISQFLAQ